MIGKAARLPRLIASDEGATAVEYGVMIALILVACMAVVTSLGGTASATFSSVNSAATGS